MSESQKSWILSCLARINHNGYHAPAAAPVKEPMPQGEQQAQASHAQRHEHAEGPAPGSLGAALAAVIRKNRWG